MADVVITPYNNPFLFHIDSVLVSSNWNKNDYVFLPEELWKARFTPVGTPFDLEHIQHEILGHTYQTDFLDSDNNPVISADALPSLVHLKALGVIYTGWTDPGLHSRREREVKKIQAGEYSVSMEAVYERFDYAIAQDDSLSSFDIIGHTDATDFLTKYLRLFGGDGYYKKKRIGAVFRGLVFTGMGLVENPANPLSTISPGNFSPSVVISSLPSSTHNAGPTTMSTELETLKAHNATLLTQVSTIQASSAASESKVEMLSKGNEELKASVVTLTQDLAQAHAALTASEEALKNANQKLLLTERKSAVIEATGYDVVKAEKFIASTAALSDPDFTQVLTELKELKASTQTPAPTPAPTPSANPAGAIAAAVNGTPPSPTPALVASSEMTNAQRVQVALGRKAKKQ